MNSIMVLLGKIFGCVAGTFTVSFLGWSSLIAPEWSDNLNKRLREWSEKDD